jgi:hypothetical protein
VRTAYNDFIARHEVAWELVMAALAIAFVIVGFAADAPDATVGPVGRPAPPPYASIEMALTVIFAAEFTHASWRRTTDAPTYAGTSSIWSR